MPLTVALSNYQYYERFHDVERLHRLQNNRPGRRRCRYGPARMLALHSVLRICGLLGNSHGRSVAQAIDISRSKFQALHLEAMEDAPDRRGLHCICVLHGVAHWLRQGI